MANTIYTSSGQYFWFEKPWEHDFKVEEIAHALSLICRFTGHIREFYSVAQHSVLVSLIVPHEFALEGLMHDASEAYLGDVSSPLKALLPDYRAIEQRVEAAIALQHGLRFPLSPEVKHADMRMLMTEKRDLSDSPDDDHWPKGFTPLASVVEPLSPLEAEYLFLARYNELKKEYNGVYI